MNFRITVTSVKERNGNQRREFFNKVLHHFTSLKVGVKHSVNIKHSVKSGSVYGMHDSLFSIFFDI